MARRKEARYTTIFLQDGTGGTGAVDDATLVATDTTMGVDTLAMNDAVTVVPVGARFTTAGIPTVRDVTAENHSQEWNLTNGGASAGTFDLTLNGELAAGIAFDATIAAVQAALDGLASVSPGDVIVSGTDAGPWDITMAGTLANISTNVLSYDGSSLTGGPGVLTVTHNGLVTYEITFTPAIAVGSVPADDDVITWLPQRVELRPNGDTTANWTEATDPQIQFSRGIIDGATLGQEVPLNFTTAFILDWLRASSGNPITVYEALNQLGDAADWITSAGRSEGFDFCEPYCVDVVLVDSPPCGSEQAEMTFIRRFYQNDLSPTIETATVDLSGICSSSKSDNFRVDNNPDAIGSQN